MSRGVPFASNVFGVYYLYRTASVPRTLCVAALAGCSRPACS